MRWQIFEDHRSEGRSLKDQENVSQSPFEIALEIIGHKNKSEEVSNQNEDHNLPHQVQIERHECVGQDVVDRDSKDCKADASWDEWSQICLVLLENVYIDSLYFWSLNVESVVEISV